MINKSINHYGNDLVFYEEKYFIESKKEFQEAFILLLEIM